MSDTENLLKECNAGIKMGIDSIDDMLPSVKDNRLRDVMKECKETHQRLGSRTHELLNKYGDPGKEPHPMAKGMSWVKTNVRLAYDSSDQSVASLLTDGCNMGIKSLNKYLNQYSDADREVSNITKDLIKSEEKLVKDIEEFL